VKQTRDVPEPECRSRLRPES